ncbi:C2H2 transcription factor [Histoplasma capsulatum H143]|uniref:C2H2 transcription factor n=1 Tax=Ajellomyces capsulatus (strain H143) TaxID=544712 RepID=C6HNW0_AJECH|nr:C2H2 transcription factor [Histoplasma capsulatum H143]
MPQFSETPPPLQYSPPSSDHDRSSTRETTPIGTPVGFAAVSKSRTAERDRDLYFSWHRKPAEHPNTGIFQTSALLEPDLDDSTFPLFPSSPPERRTMEGPTPPINIVSRNTSVSPPGHQASNLTSALQRASTADRPAGAANSNVPSSIVYKANAVRKDSIGASMTQWGNGTKPITVTGSNRDKQRRESLAGSLVGGMSWGAFLWTGTSPFNYSLLRIVILGPAEDLKLTLAEIFLAAAYSTIPTTYCTYEEHMRQKSPQPPQSTTQTGPNFHDVRNQGQQSQQSDTGAGGNQNRGVSSPRSNQNQQTANHMASPAPQHPQTQHGGFGTQCSLSDLDTVEDMEMDDPLADNNFQNSRPRGGPIQGRFGQQNQGSLTPLNLSMLQGHQGLRNSQPGTPVTPGRPLQNNPTVSSVNTPTLVTHQLQQQQQNSGYRGTPDSSAPGTPAELDESIIGEFGDMSMMQNNALTGAQGQFSGFGGGNDMLNLFIDEPAKRLFSPTGGFSQQQSVPDTTLGLLPNEEPKPFRCPVIGCEKAYKNQNGLKYHKAHGHNNQQLHDNADGTFSIVNPETCTPYPGTLGMEKEKPFRCEVCGKRYKNLNGLKYHRSHSPPCNPELQLAAGRNLGVGGVMQGQNINVAGAGLPGIGEEGL